MALFYTRRLSGIVSLTTSEKLTVRKQQSVEIWQVVPLILAAALLTVGLAMFLSGTVDPEEVIRPVIVVFGGALAGLLLTFSPAHIGQGLQIAVLRGLHGGTAPESMLRAMLKICEVSRRDGLLGVADVRSNSEHLEEVCHLIGDASDEHTIQQALDRRITHERRSHQMTTDVFTFTAIYAVLIGMLSTLLQYVEPIDEGVSRVVVLPFVCGISLAILMCILVGRLRAAHYRELLVFDIAFQGATMILQDNNAQRLRHKLSLILKAASQR